MNNAVSNPRPKHHEIKLPLEKRFEIFERIIENLKCDVDALIINVGKLMAHKEIFDKMLAEKQKKNKK